MGLGARVSNRALQVVTLRGWREIGYAMNRFRLGHDGSPNWGCEVVRGRRHPSPVPQARETDWCHDHIPAGSRILAAAGVCATDDPGPGDTHYLYLRLAARPPRTPATCSACRAVAALRLG